MRRSILLCVLVLFVIGTGVVAVPSSYPRATSAASVFDEYPKLSVTVTDDAYILDVAEVPAGLVVVSVINTTQDSVDAAIVGPAPGQTAAELIAAAAIPPASPGELAPFLYDATLPGGPTMVPVDETREELVLLTEGDWGVFGADGRTPGIFAAVTGDGSLTEPPTADVEVEMGDFSFSGLTNSVPAGPQIWKVTTKGEQPHALMLVGVPAGTPPEDVLAIFGIGDPSSAGAPTSADLVPVTDGVSLQSDGQSLWLPVTLEAGTYAVVCFVPDPTTGKSHMEEGMLTVFEVA